MRQDDISYRMQKYFMGENWLKNTSKYAGADLSANTLCAYSKREGGRYLFMLMEERQLSMGWKLTIDDLANGKRVAETTSYAIAYALITWGRNLN